VPNVLLQTDWKINVYGYTGDYTKYDKCFKVIARTRPTDYAYTETEVLTFNDLVARCDEKITNVDIATGNAFGAAEEANKAAKTAFEAGASADSSGIYASMMAEAASAAAQRCEAATAQILGSLEVIEYGDY
jgi:hypothetical protein